MSDQFTGHSQQRIARETKKSERRRVNDPQRRARYPLAGGVGVRYAKTGPGGIGPKSGLTLGSADDCLLYRRNGSTLTLTSTTVTVKNATPGSVAPNADIVIAPDDGTPPAFVVIVEPCA